MTGRVLSVPVAIVVLAMFFPSGGWCQVKYSPDDEFVEKMARAGVEYLSNNHPPGADETTLAAIAVIETYKRYESYIPSDHPLVQRAIELIREDLEEHRAERTNGLSAGPIYYCCLATILLMEVNDELYRPEILALMDIINRRRQPTGAWGYGVQPWDHGDTSQSQYVGLCFAVAKRHGYPVDWGAAGQLLGWYCDVQINGVIKEGIDHRGTWIYHYLNNKQPDVNGDIGIRHSLHVAGAGTIYLLGDLLNLNPRVRSATSRDMFTGLPPSVRIYVKPKEGQEREKEGPLVSFDRGRMTSAKLAANDWLARHWTLDTREWNYYYLYGLERYAYFRELSEGEMPEFPTWYDGGVDFLHGLQEPEGSWTPKSQIENRTISTCFAILFLVRSAELLMADAGSGTMTGNEGFGKGQLRIDDGNVRSSDEVQTIEDVMTALREASPEENLDRLVDSLGPAIKDFTQKEGRSRVEVMAFLRGLVSDESFYKRLVAVRVLARQQDLDSVPALIYALTDPSLAICAEAHRGLRLVSRKLDAFPLSDKPTRAEFDNLVQLWTDWYLGIRPGAVLYEMDK